MQQHLPFVAPSAGLKLLHSTKLAASHHRLLLDDFFQYQYGRCIADIEEQEIHQKQALVDDDRRSKSPLRWISGVRRSTTAPFGSDAQLAGNAYGRGLERAVSSITTDDTPPKDRRVGSHQHRMALTRARRSVRDRPQATTTSTASSTWAASRQRSGPDYATAT
eukprot:764436-Hanusia_phi.AAC.1